MQTVKAIARKIGIIVSGSIVALALAGLIYQHLAIEADLDRFPPPGILTKVDGKYMHLFCQGAGSPTVIIEQGAGGYYDTWAEVNSSMSQFTRVCAYDRAGAGYSDALGHPLRIEETSERLHQLLQQTGIDDDLILVGWSAGGVFVRDYYNRYPEQVKGMVLVDSSHEQQRSRLIDPAPPQHGIDTRRIGGLLAPLGVVRLSGEIDRIVDAGPGTIEQKERLKVIQKQSHWLNAFFDEMDGFEVELAFNRNPLSLGDLPLTVISRGKAVEQGGMPSWYTLEILQENEAIWQAMQQELVALSLQGTQVIAEHSGHSVHLDQPESIIDSVRDMVLRGR